MSSVGYLGFFPVAPGTVASAFAVLVYVLVGPLQQAAVLAPAIVAVFILGGISVGVVLRRGGGPKDPSHVVCDEIAGQWIALLSLGLPRPLGVHPDGVPAVPPLRCVEASARVVL